MYSSPWCGVFVRGTVPGEAAASNRHHSPSVGCVWNSVAVVVDDDGGLGGAYAMQYVRVARLPRRDRREDSPCQWGCGIGEIEGRGTRPKLVSSTR